MPANRTKESATRLFRRLRAKFKADLGLETLTGADRILIDQCALLALRARQMRDDILSGEKPVDDDALVRTTNAAIRAMKALTDRGKGQAPPRMSIAQQIMQQIEEQKESTGDDE